MVRIVKASHSRAEGYPENTGRLQRVISSSDSAPIKIALMGDSTIDNGYWVDKDKPYLDRTATVCYQTALAVAAKNTGENFDVANFAVDGATTSDINRHCRLNKVLPTDADHSWEEVHQIQAVQNWQPDIIALSVGGNNYREALQGRYAAEASGGLTGPPNLILRPTAHHAA